MMKNIRLIGYHPLFLDALIDIDNEYYYVTPPYNKSNAKRIHLNDKLLGIKTYRNWKEFKEDGIKHYSITMASWIGDAYLKLRIQSTIEGHNPKRAIIEECNRHMKNNSQPNSTFKAIVGLWSSKLIDKRELKEFISMAKASSHPFPSRIKGIPSYPTIDFSRQVVPLIGYSRSVAEKEENFSEAKSILIFLKSFCCKSNSITVNAEIEELFLSISKMERTIYAKENTSDKSWQYGLTFKCYPRGGPRF